MVVNKLNNKGVTLVELIVSFAIVGVAIIYFFQTLSTVKKIYSDARNETDFYVKKDYDFENAFIIDDDYSYILSLCKINSFMLLEVRNSNIFTGLIDKSEIKDDLVVINHFAKEILDELYN